MKATEKYKLVEYENSRDKIIEYCIAKMQPESTLFIGQKLLVIQVAKQATGNQIHGGKGKSFA